MNQTIKNLISVLSVVLSIVSVFIIIIAPFATAKPVYLGIGISYLVLTVLIWITYFVLKMVDKKYNYSENNIHYKRTLYAFSELSVWFIYGFKTIYGWIKSLVGYIKAKYLK